MAAKLTKHIFLIFIIVMTTATCSAESPNSYKLQAYELALKKLETAKTNLEKKIEECHKKKTIIPKNAFKHLNLTNKEWKIALYVLSDRAEDACEAGKRGELVTAASIYRTTSKHYKRKAEFAAPYSENLLFGHYWMKLEAEAKYLNISVKKRELLEKIPQIKMPFHLFKTLSALGIE